MRSVSKLYSAVFLMFAVAQLAAQVSLATPSVNEIAMQKKLDDWAQLGRYRADNAALPAPAPGENRVVFFGDSITDNWGRGAGVFFPGKPYVNRGISGQTTPQMLVRFEQDVVHLHPAAVVILAGTNDIAGNTGPSTPEMIEDNFRAMSAVARQNGIGVVLASILPAHSYPWKPVIQPAPIIRKVTSGSRSIAPRSTSCISMTTPPWLMGRARCCPAFPRMAFTPPQPVTPSWHRSRRVPSGWRLQKRLGKPVCLHDR